VLLTSIQVLALWKLSHALHDYRMYYVHATIASIIIQLTGFGLLLSNVYTSAGQCVIFAGALFFQFIALVAVINFLRPLLKWTGRKLAIRLLFALGLFGMAACGPLNKTHWFPVSRVTDSIFMS
jgi:hypothetical protein